MEEDQDSLRDRLNAYAKASAPEALRRKQLLEANPGTYTDTVLLGAVHQEGQCSGCGTTAPLGYNSAASFSMPGFRAGSTLHNVCQKCADTHTEYYRSLQATMDARDAQDRQT